jgi:RES domain-containing protein
VIDEQLRDGHLWLRIFEAGWDDPLDDRFAARRGGRWNPPGSWRTL